MLMFGTVMQTWLKKNRTLVEEDMRFFKGKQAETEEEERRNVRTVRILT
jgi:hypothetical protein